MARVPFCVKKVFSNYRGRKTYMWGKIFGILKIRYGTLFGYFIYKKLIVIHSSYEELDDTKWDVWVLCLWLRFSKGHRTGYIWAHKSMKTNDNSFVNFQNPDRINNYLTSTYTKGKYILIAWLYYCLNGWFRALSHSQIWKFNNLLIFTNKENVSCFECCSYSSRKGI